MPHHAAFYLGLTTNKLISYERNVSESNQGTAEILNKFFSSVVEKEGGEKFPKCLERNDNQTLDH